MHAGVRVPPDVTFKTRVRDDSIEGPNPFRWQDMTTADYFAGKRVVLFSLPGAFTPPTCSTYQLPGYENGHADFAAEGIDEIYCMSVNDSFVMNKWAQAQELENVKVIPDGSGEFTRKIGMLVAKDNLASVPAPGATPPSSTTAWSKPGSKSPAVTTTSARTPPMAKAPPRKPSWPG